MEQAMKELLSVMKTMSPEQIVDFMSQLFVGLDDKTQEMFVTKVSQLMGEQGNNNMQGGENKIEEGVNEVNNQEAKPQQQLYQEKTITPEQKRQSLIGLM